MILACNTLFGEELLSNNINNAILRNVTHADQLNVASLQCVGAMSTRDNELSYAEIARVGRPSLRRSRSFKVTDVSTNRKTI